MTTQKLAEVILFTNGVVITFDESGMAHSIQGKIASKQSWDKRAIIRLILQDNPEIKLARWQQWVHTINKEEFFLLTNHYYEYQAVIEEANEEKS